MYHDTFNNKKISELTFAKLRVFFSSCVKVLKDSEVGLIITDTDQICSHWACPVLVTNYLCNTRYLQFPHFCNLFYHVNSTRSSPSYTLSWLR